MPGPSVPVVPVQRGLRCQACLNKQLLVVQRMPLREIKKKREDITVEEINEIKSTVGERESLGRLHVGSDVGLSLGQDKSPKSTVVGSTLRSLWKESSFAMPKDARDPTPHQAILAYAQHHGVLEAIPRKVPWRM